LKKTLEITPDNNPKQKKALKTLFSNTNGVSEVLYGGAAGGGKSWVGCEWLIVSCLKYPESRWLMGRSRMKDLKLTTYQTFINVCKSVGLKQGVHWKLNGQYNVITWFNGSEIVLKDLFQYPSDPDFDGLGSLEITGAFIDEVNQCTQKAKDVVMSRIRYKLDEFGLTPKIFMSCNPAKNWVYNDFYKPSTDGTLLPYRVFIQALVDDNQFISKHYKENLRRLTDRASKKRLLFGEWEYSDELSMFDFARLQEAFVRRRKVRKGSRYFMAVDVARLGKDKTVIAVCSETLEIVEFLEMSKGRTTDVIKKIKKIQVKYNIDEYDIAIDSDGVGGGVADAFENAEHIVNNARALNGENYYNLKTQLYFKLAEVFNDEEIAFNHLPDQIAERLEQELQILRREKIEMDGKVCMTNKSQIKKQINRSPDYSDTIAYLMIFFLEDLDDSYFTL
tara:strand:- start:1408 stop:2751 length:1344 start_codon:yes stop_codon:yes gene_type:complete